MRFSVETLCLNAGSSACSSILISIYQPKHFTSTNMKSKYFIARCSWFWNEFNDKYVCAVRYVDSEHGAVIALNMPSTVNRMFRVIESKIYDRTWQYGGGHASVWKLATHPKWNGILTFGLYTYRNHYFVCKHIHIHKTS